jgi:hypothetical protein
VRKKKGLLKEIADRYVSELEAHFPGIKAEVLWESVGGSDGFVDVRLPPQWSESYIDVLDTTVQLNFRFYDETGVKLVAMVVDEEPAPA